MNYSVSGSSKLVTIAESKYNNDYANYKVAGPSELVTMSEPRYNNDYANGGGKKQTIAAVNSAPTKHMVDSDGDGVNDDMDKCPNTPNGVKVNSLGCPVDQKVEMKINIQFDNGKAVIKPEFKDEIESIAKILESHTDLGAEVQGHTDNTGNAASNTKLSDERANAVKEYIISNYKVERMHLTAKGYGSKKPIASNKTAEGREQNRRVVAVIHSLSEVKELKANKKAEEASLEKKAKKK